MPIGVAVPGWTGYAGTVQQTTVLHNSLSTGTAFISIVGPDSPSTEIYQGNYTIALVSGVDQLTGRTPVGVSIAQTGQIPIDARSLLFFDRLDSLQVSFAGLPLTTHNLSNTGDPLAFKQYGADISAFAGQTGELRFTIPPSLTAPTTAAYLDFISFSPVGIPEPSVFGLFVLGSLLLGWRFWKRKGRFTNRARFDSHKQAYQIPLKRVCVL